MLQATATYPPPRRRSITKCCHVLSRRSRNGASLPPPQQHPIFSSRIVVVVLLWFAISSTMTMIHAFSSGAGSCTSGGPPVGGFHLDTKNPVDGSSRTVLEGALSQGDVVILINNNANDPVTEDVPYVLQTQTSYTLTVVTTRDPGYKGILIRMSSADSNAMDVPTDVLLQPTDSLLKIAETCFTESNTIGLTHVTNIEKFSVTADLVINTPGTVALEISIVGANDNVASVYGYSQFTLQIEGAALVTTESPTVTPTRAPVLPPGTTAAPSATPTMGDFLIDTASPTYNTTVAAPPPSSSNGTNNDDSSTSGARSFVSWYIRTNNSFVVVTIWTMIVLVVGSFSIL